MGFGLGSVDATMNAGDRRAGAGRTASWRRSPPGGTTARSWVLWQLRSLPPPPLTLVRLLPGSSPWSLVGGAHRLSTLRARSPGRTGAARTRWRRRRRCRGGPAGVRVRRRFSPSSSFLGLQLVGAGPHRRRRHRVRGRLGLCRLRVVHADRSYVRRPPRRAPGCAVAYHGWGLPAGRGRLIVVAFAPTAVIAIAGFAIVGLGIGPCYRWRSSRPLTTTRATPVSRSPGVNVGSYIGFVIRGSPGRRHRQSSRHCVWASPCWSPRPWASSPDGSVVRLIRPGESGVSGCG